MALFLYNSDDRGPVLAIFISAIQGYPLWIPESEVEVKFRQCSLAMAKEHHPDNGDTSC